MSDKEMADLADEFEALCTKVQPQIIEKLAKARELIDEAVALAEEHGVPFMGSPSRLRNAYVPESFSSSKFAKLDEEIVQEIAGVYGEYMSEVLDSGGWLHSAVC
jgi:hypothetical protein